MNQEKDINFSHYRGNLVRKPELRGNEKKYAFLTIACNRGYANENGKFEADFIDLKLWKDAEKFVEDYDKGQKIEVKAHTKTGSYENDKGEKVYTKDLIVDEIIPLNLEKENQEEKENNDLEMGN